MIHQMQLSLLQPIAFPVYHLAYWAKEEAEPGKRGWLREDMI